jgi:hypothetical protein
MIELPGLPERRDRRGSARRAATQAKRFGAELLVGWPWSAKPTLQSPHTSNGRVACHAIGMSPGMAVRELDALVSQPRRAGGITAWRCPRPRVPRPARGAGAISGRARCSSRGYAAQVTVITVRKPSLSPAMSNI